MEIWKKIVDHPNYEVSNLGRVKKISDLRNGKNIILTSRLNRGYLTVSINKKNFYIHRLMLETFIGKSHLQVDHIDGNKLNNSLTNLRWLDSYTNKCRSWCTPVLLKHLITGEEFFFRSQKEASMFLKVNPGRVARVISGKLKKVKEFTIKYANVDPSQYFN